MKQLVVKNFWLKVLALFLAVIVWLYVVGELNKGTPDEKSLFDRILPSRLAAKEIPIKVALVGKPRPGYHLLSEEISVKPSSCVILTSRNLLKNIGYLTTEEIDISEFTKSIAKEIKVRPVGPGVILEKDFYVTVVIPIRKLEEQKQVTQ